MLELNSGYAFTDECLNCCTLGFANNQCLFETCVGEYSLDGMRKCDCVRKANYELRKNWKEK